MASGLPRYDPQTLRGVSPPATPRDCYYYEEATPVLTGGVLQLPCPATTATTTLTTTYGDTYRHITRRRVEGGGEFSVRSHATQRKSVGELIMGFEKDTVLARSEPPERPPSAPTSAVYAFPRRGGDQLAVSPSNKSTHDMQNGVTLQRTELDSPTTEIDLWSVGAARVVYWIKQLPALILLAIAAWITIGYQIFIDIPKATMDKDEITRSCVLDAIPPFPFEFAAAGGAAATAAAAIIGALRGCCKKPASLGAAKAISIWRLFFAVLCVGFAAPTIVFAVLVIIKLRETATHALLFSDVFPLECFTPTGRLMLNSCILAGAAVLLVLSLFSFSFCVAALVRLSKTRREARLTRASKFSYFHDIGVYDTPTDRY